MATTATKRTLRKRNSNKIRENGRVSTIVMYAIAILVLFITLYPMYYVLILSLSEPSAAATMKVYTVPKGFSLAAYETLVTDSEMWRAYFNTFLYVVPTTLLMLLTCVLAAYPLTYKNLRGRKYINMFLLIPMYFSGGMIPSFLLITKLGLYDNPWSQILPACYSIWNIILVPATSWMKRRRRTRLRACLTGRARLGKKWASPCRKALPPPTMSPLS